MLVHHLSRRALLRLPASYRAFSAAAPSVPAALVKQLREATGAPMMECKNALLAEGVNGNVEKAIEWLRKKGMAAASKKAGRVAAQGLIAASVHESELAGVLVEVNCETDFVSRNDMFRELASRTNLTAIKTFSEDPASGSLSSPLFSSSFPSVSHPEGDVKALGETHLAAPSSSSSASALAATGVNTTASPAGTVLLELIGKIRENMVLRRVGALILPKPSNPKETSSFVSLYIHNSAGPGLGSIGVLLGLTANGKAEVIAKPETKAALKEFGRKLAMHVAGSKPLYASRDAVPQQELEKERAILRSQAASSGKSAAIIDRMVEGRLGKFFGETVLLDQPYVLSEEGASVKKVMDEQAKKLGLTSIAVPGFLSYVVGQSPAAAKEVADAAAKEASGGSEMK